MQGYDPDGNDIGYKCVKRIQRDDSFVAVDSVRRAKLAGMNHVRFFFCSDGKLQAKRMFQVEYGGGAFGLKNRGALAPPFLTLSA